MPGGTVLMLRFFGEWWLRQILALLHRIRPPRQQDATIIVLERLEPPFTGLVLRHKSGSETTLGRLEGLAAIPNDLPVHLRLPAKAVLTRTVTLPLAVERDVKTALEFEIERLTPFSAEELFWGIGGIIRDQALQKLRLTLLITPRAPLTPVLETLRRRQLRLESLESMGTRIPLQTAAARQYRMLAWPAICAVLAIICLALPLLRQQIALGEVHAMVAARAPAAAAAQRLRAALAEAAAGQTEVAAARRRGDPLAVLAGLSRALPDDTWLSDVSLKDGSLTMDGQSGNAARLIALLAAEPALRDPSFTAPVTRTSDNKADLFSLRAELTQ